MARPLRIQQGGFWYHVTSRGNERGRIFRDDRDREHFLELLGKLVERFGWQLHSYALMNNHYHLEVEIGAPNLSRGMQWLQVSYSVWFNRRHDRVGHLFQGRFKAVVVEPEEWGVQLSHYIHLNPLRVARLGLGKTDRERQRMGAEPTVKEELVRRRLNVLRNYRWSSYRAHAGLEPAPKWLQSGWLLQRMGGGSEREKRRLYRQEVERLLSGDGLKNPWESLEGGLLLGSAEWVARIKRRILGDAKEQPEVRKLKLRPQWGQVVEEVEREKGERWEEFRDRYGDWGRDVALALGRQECGLKLRELGELCGGMDYRTVGTAATKVMRQVEREPKVRRRYERIRGRLWK